MTTESIKIELIQWLSSLKDKQFLESLLFYKSIQENTDWFESLSPEQMQKIEQGLQEAKEGKVISNKKVWEKYGRKPKD